MGIRWGGSLYGWDAPDEDEPREIVREVVRDRELKQFNCPYCPSVFMGPTDGPGVGEFAAILEQHIRDCHPAVWHARKRDRGGGRPAIDAGGVTDLKPDGRGGYE